VRQEDSGASLSSGTDTAQRGIARIVRVITLEDHDSSLCNRTTIDKRSCDLLRVS
jgi:hypothetical protein